MTEILMRVKTTKFYTPIYRYIPFTEEQSFLWDNKVVKDKRTLTLNYSEAINYCHNWIREHGLISKSSIQIFEVSHYIIRKVLYELTAEKAKRLILS